MGAYVYLGCVYCAYQTSLFNGGYARMFVIYCTPLFPAHAHQSPTDSIQQLKQPEYILQTFHIPGQSLTLLFWMFKNEFGSFKESSSVNGLLNV